jgi:hypothetical protein
MWCRYKVSQFLVADPDTEEKRTLGGLWAARSGRKTIFLIAERPKDGMSVDGQIKATWSGIRSGIMGEIRAGARASIGVALT